MPTFKPSALNVGFIALTLAISAHAQELPPWAGSTPVLVFSADLPAKFPSGLSGLTALPTGDLLAVSERAERVLRFHLSEDQWTGAVTQFNVLNSSDELELESLSALPFDRLAFGTESHIDGREEDFILIANFSPDSGIEVVDSVSLDWGYFGLTGGENKGLEAICYNGTRIFAMGEQVGFEDGHRFAPLWVVGIDPFRDGEHVRLALTSETGKISAAACRAQQDGVELFTIERHFGVANLVRYLIPYNATEAEPQNAVDLRPYLQSEGQSDNFLNPEGLALVNDTLWIITDNEYAGTRVTARLLALSLLPE
ncbi:MAG: hypothetical protein KC561_02105 [Myxococcales bacterium]|nr:hypothetical protein [Myxococcales bacterium]